MNSVRSKSNHIKSSNKSTLPLPSLSTSSQYLYIFRRSRSGISNSNINTLKPRRIAGVCGNSGNCSFEQHRCRNSTRSNRFGLCGFFTGMSCRSDAWNLSYCLAVSRVSQTTRFPYIRAEVVKSSQVSMKSSQSKQLSNVDRLVSYYRGYPLRTNNLLK